MLANGFQFQLMLRISAGFCILHHASWVGYMYSILIGFTNPVILTSCVIGEFKTLSSKRWLFLSSLVQLPRLLKFFSSLETKVK